MRTFRQAIASQDQEKDMSRRKGFMDRLEAKEKRLRNELGVMYANAAQVSACKKQLKDAQRFLKDAIDDFSIAVECGDKEEIDQFAQELDAAKAVVAKVKQALHEATLKPHGNRRVRDVEGALKRVQRQLRENRGEVRLTHNPFAAALA